MKRPVLLPFAAGQSAATEHGGSFFIAGGWTTSDNDDRKRFYRYTPDPADPNADTVTRMADVPIRIEFCTLVTLGTKIVLIGHNEFVSLEVCIYDVPTDTWSYDIDWRPPLVLGEPLLPASGWVRGIGSPVDPDSVIIIGDHGFASHSCISFSIGTKAWTTLEPMLIVRSGGALYVTGTDVVFAGGQNGTLWTAGILVYDAVANEWSSQAERLCAPIEYSNAEFINGKAIMFGHSLPFESSEHYYNVWEFDHLQTNEECTVRADLSFQDVFDPFSSAHALIDNGDGTVSLFAIGGMFQATGTAEESRQVWAVTFTPPELPPVGKRRFDQADLAAGDPSHLFVSRDGGPAQPFVANWTMREVANGGLIAATGRVRAEDVEAAAQVLREEATWRTVVQQTGEVVFHGPIKEAGGNAGVVDLSANGVGAQRPQEEFDAFLVADDDYGRWQPIQDEPLSIHAPPKEAPDGFTIAGGTGNLAIGTYRYAVSFVTDEIETALGPEAEIPVELGEDPANIRLRHIPRGGNAVSARKIYRRDPGSGVDEFRLLATLGDNTTETYDDSTASVAGNAMGLEDVNSGAIQVAVRNGALEMKVEKDVVVTADQRSGFVKHIRTADGSGLRLLIAPNRSLDNWELRVATAEGGEGPFTNELTLDLAGRHSKRRTVWFVNNRTLDTVRVELRRKTTGADTEPLKLRIEELRWYGVADDDDFSTSDVVRAVCRRINVSDALVRSTGVPALPQLFEDTNWAAVLDLQALLSGCVWGFYVDGDKTVCRFGRYGAFARWILGDPEVQPDLLPQPRYSRVQVFDHERRFLAEANASPNLLGYRRTAPPVRLPFRVSKEIAEVLAQRLADEYVQRRWSGTIPIPRVYNEFGVPGPHLLVRAGDELLVPRLGVWLPLHEVEHTDAMSTATVQPGMPMLERFIARMERKRAAA